MRKTKESNITVDSNTNVLEGKLEISQSWRRRTAIEMIVSGLIGLVASFVLSIEAWQLARDSDRTFSCDLNAVFSCSTVAKTPQSTVLGFPNAFLGIFFEAVVLSISVAIACGVRFPRLYMLAAELLYTIGLLFALWLFLQSYFVIGVLCPWCVLVTFTTILVWSGLTRINTMEHNLPATSSWRSFINRGYDWAIIGLVVFALFALLAAKYIPFFLDN